MKFKDVCKQVREEVVVNNVGAGKIAGTAEAGDDPVVNRKKKVIAMLKRKMTKSTL